MQCQVVHACGARTSAVRTGAELRAVLAEGLALRSTVETQANPISSRSHAICALRFGAADGAAAAAEGAGGRAEAILRLVDLAGSERNYETHQMASREFARDSAAINKGLMALKDCFHAAARARGAKGGGAAPPSATAPGRGRIPYRSAMLTRVLRGCFADADHRTAIVAAVAPGAESILHTLNTMVRPPLLRRCCPAPPPLLPLRPPSLHPQPHTLLPHPHPPATALQPSSPGPPSFSRSPPSPPPHPPAAPRQEHVSLMAPHLSQASCEVDVPMCGDGSAAGSWQGTAVHEWSAQQVLEWLASADGGRFSDVVVPPGIDGRGLLGMNARRLTQMAESGQAAGRTVGELPAAAAGDRSLQAKVRTAIFHALRDAQRMEGQGRGVARACA
jgi:hypothetical protein